MMRGSACIERNHSGSLIPSASRAGTKKRERDSRFELLRIVCMMLIVLHHFALHGEWTGDIPRVFIDWISMGGKVGVDCFIFISAYFLIRSRFKIRSLLRVVLETLFYSLVILAVMVFVDPSQVTTQSIEQAFTPVSSYLYWFVSSYVVMVLLSPFMNRFLLSISREEHRRLILVIFAFLCMLPTAFSSTFLESGVLWFLFLYILAAYWHLYGVRVRPAVAAGMLVVGVGAMMANSAMINLCVSLIPSHTTASIAPRLVCIAALVACTILLWRMRRSRAVWAIAVLWVAIDLALSVTLGVSDVWSDSQRLAGLNQAPPLAAAAGLFMLFASMRPFSAHWINVLASCAFGVYLIHENPMVCHELWQHNYLLEALPTPALYVAAVGIAAGVYLACAIVDLVRQHALERPVMALIDRGICGKVLDRVDAWFNGEAAQTRPIAASDMRGAASVQGGGAGERGESR